MARLIFAIKFFIPLSVLLVRVDAQTRGFQNDEMADKCTTPRGLEGYCIGIYQCESLLAILKNPPLTASSIDLLRRSNCGWINSNPKVCCPFDRNVDNNGRRNSDNGEVDLSLRNDNLLPVDCGRGLTLRIIGGERTELDEFPWMVLLEYDTPNGPVTACGGALISQRYVLTAAHCIKSKGMKSTWKLSNVRLGEYDTATDRDCVQDGEYSQICADPTVTVPIEEKIMHEQYNPQSKDQRYDIALLRLSENVSFTKYIKPICLPSNSTFPEDSIVAGWGKTETASRSNVKLKIKLPLADMKRCTERYSTARVTLGHGQVCVGGERGKDSCRGDSGGPLMSAQRMVNGTPRWTAVGIVSFGPTPCGMVDWPGIYTRTFEYTSWIHSKLRP